MYEIREVERRLRDTVADVGGASLAVYTVATIYIMSDGLPSDMRKIFVDGDVVWGSKAVTAAKFFAPVFRQTLASDWASISLIEAEALVAAGITAKRDEAGSLTAMVYRAQGKFTSAENAEVKANVESAKVLTETAAEAEAFAKLLPPSKAAEAKKLVSAAKTAAAAANKIGEVSPILSDTEAANVARLTRAGDDAKASTTLVESALAEVREAAVVANAAEAKAKAKLVAEAEAEANGTTLARLLESIEDIDTWDAWYLAEAALAKAHDSLMAVDSKAAKLLAESEAKDKATLEAKMAEAEAAAEAKLADTEAKVVEALATTKVRAKARAKLARDTGAADAEASAKAKAAKAEAKAAKAEAKAAKATKRNSQAATKRRRMVA